MNLFEEFEKSNYEQWANEASKALKGKPLEKLFTTTYEGITVKPLYTKENLPEEFKNELPGLPFFLRSWKIDGNRIQPWKIIQRIEIPDPKEANKILKNEHEKGSDGFLIKHFSFDLTRPSGVIIESILDFEELFDGIDLTKTQIHFETNYPFELSQFFFAYLDVNKVQTESVFGSFQNNLLFEKIQKGKLIERKLYLEHFFFKTFDFCQKSLPNFKTFVVDGTMFYESGANAIQEIAFTLNYAIEYLKFLLQKKVDINDVLDKFILKISVGSDIFLNLAKLRALRILWAKIAEYLGQNNVSIPIYAITSRRNKSRLDVYVNMLRNTSETFTAILGTADFIEVTPFDYFSSPTNEFSYRNARNTQLVLKDEHNLCDVIDPAGGSWLLESLTFEIALQALSLFKDIEQTGGFFQNIQNGTIQAQINEVKIKRLAKLAWREEILVGTNLFPNPEDNFEDLESFIEYDKLLKEARTKAMKLQKELGSAKEILEFAKNYGVISSSISFKEELENSFEVEPLRLFRDSEEFENLRKKSLEYKQKFGNRPTVLLIPFGKVSEYRDRRDFSNDFFLVGGFDVVGADGVKTIEEAFQKFYETQPQIVVFCSSDEKYGEFVPQLSALIKKAKPLTIVVVAGLPPENEFALFASSGVDEFIHIKSNIIEILNKFFKYLLGN
ncbi:MAG: methylmalonyl-CoA mutase family protein [Candidatus Kapaibacteriota bacterium]